MVAFARRLRVSNAGLHPPIGAHLTNHDARTLIETLFDGFAAGKMATRRVDPIGFPGYAQERDRATDEGSVIWGTATIGDLAAIAAVFDFSCFGGSMGVVEGDRLEAAMKAAARAGAPFIAVTASGGARMQEGMAALSQMPRTVAASVELAKKGVPRIGVLCHPTTGGVYASFASLSDLLIGEQQATLGFAGPRVAESMTGEKLPEGSHSAATAYRLGQLDATADLPGIKEWLGAALRALAPVDQSGLKTARAAANPAVTDAPPPKDAWKQFGLARHSDRPAPSTYLAAICEEFVGLHGDRAGKDDPAVGAGVGRLSGIPFVAVALDRGRPSAGGFRKARRAIALADRLRFPLVTLVDTPGADPSFQSEYSGLASEIAGTFEAMLTCRSPVISIVTGEGGSGGALALACGDVVAMQQNAVFSVISPEGASTILYRDTAHAPQLAASMKTTAADLLDLGLIDGILLEPKPAHSAVSNAIGSLAAFLMHALGNTKPDPGGRAARFRRF